MLKSNNTMTDLTLADITMTVKDGFSSVLEGLCNRESCNITSLNFSNSQVEDKGLNTLATFLKRHDRPLIRLNLSNTGGTSKGYQSIISALVENSQKILENLEFLSFANNWKIDQSLSALINQLCAKNMPHLKKLRLNSTAANLKSVFDGLLYSKSPIKYLDLSNNRITKTEDVDAMVSFLQNAVGLESLSLKHTSISPEHLQRILLAINSDLSLDINLSDNSMVRN